MHHIATLRFPYRTLHRVHLPKQAALTIRGMFTPIAPFHSQYVTDTGPSWHATHKVTKFISHSPCTFKQERQVTYVVICPSLHTFVNPSTSGIPNCQPTRLLSGVCARGDAAVKQLHLCCTSGSASVPICRAPSLVGYAHNTHPCAQTPCLSQSPDGSMTKHPVPPKSIYSHSTHPTQLLYNHRQTKTCFKGHVSAVGSTSRSTAHFWRPGESGQTQRYFLGR